MPKIHIEVKTNVSANDIPKGAVVELIKAAVEDYGAEGYEVRNIVATISPDTMMAFGCAHKYPSDPCAVITYYDNHGRILHRPDLSSSY